MEIEHFGFNAVTAGFVGIVSLTLISTWGIWRQGQIIRLERSGLSVSVPSFLYATFVKIPNMIYGLSIGSLALIACGVIPLFPLLLTVVNLHKFKGFDRRDWSLCGILAVGVVLTAVLPMKNLTYSVWMCLAVVFSVLQPLEMWRNRDAGVVDLQMLLINLFGSLVWFVYAFAIDDLALKIVNPPFLAINIVSFILWFVYGPLRRRPKTTVS